ncbi:hypothetical protein IWX75_003207 [Arthrobacter sp. CAN_A6]
MVNLVVTLSALAARYAYFVNLSTLVPFPVNAAPM